MPSRTALLVVDVQTGLLRSDPPLHERDRFLANVCRLIESARASQVPVVYLRHETTAGELAHGMPGWAIHPAVAPQSGDTVVDKRHNDGFHATTLQEELQRIGTLHLVVAGVQTEFCVDTTCRRAYSLGYQVTLVGDAHTTFDTEVLAAAQIIAHHNRTLGVRLTRVTSTDDLAW